MVNFYILNTFVNHIIIMIFLTYLDESVNYQISDSIAYEEGKENGNQYELTFIAELDALGLKVYNVKKSSTVGYEMDKPTTDACKCKLGGIVIINLETHLLMF